MTTRFSDEWQLENRRTLTWKPRKQDRNHARATFDVLKQLAQTLDGFCIIGNLATGHRSDRELCHRASRQRHISEVHSRAQRTEHDGVD